MNLKSSSQHSAEALVHAGSYGRPRAAAEAGPGSDLATASAFTIAVSREVGARGTSVAREVGSRLGWPVYDHELLEKIAQGMKARVDVLESVDEKPVSWLQECLQAFASEAPRVNEESYVRHLVKTFQVLGAHGACVIVGRGAAHFLPAETTLRVRLVALWEDRVKVMSRELGLSQPEAARHIETLDRQRTAFARNHFQKDPADPRHYDLVLNSSRFSVAECATLIIEALRGFQERAAAQTKAQETKAEEGGIPAAALHD